ncbi:hypothetical protein GCM10027515_03300 [Schumannella luteola]
MAHPVSPTATRATIETAAARAKAFFMVIRFLWGGRRCWPVGCGCRALGTCGGADAEVPVGADAARERAGIRRDSPALEKGVSAR